MLDCERTAPLRVCVYGLWHLGVVTSACLAQHFSVVACDPDAVTIGNLHSGQAPVQEPHLARLLRGATESGKLSFTTDVSGAVSDSNVVWITFDTPIDEHDNAIVDPVFRSIEELFPYFPDDCTVLISSQVPVGFTTEVQAAFQRSRPSGIVTFAYSPENLQLGRAVASFGSRDRIVVGVPNFGPRRVLESLLAPFSSVILWMSVESAEMTKHALNAFLATSVAFINEVAILCERVGADASEVEQGLKTERRIGPRAYLAPGGAFAGGTLARDVRYLSTIARDVSAPVRVLPAVYESNEIHRQWCFQTLKTELGDLNGRTVAILGLTYTEGTNTLRRSSAVELAHALAMEGARVQAYDRNIIELPAGDRSVITLCSSVTEAAHGADALVVTPGHREFAALMPVDLLGLVADRPVLVVDADGLLTARWTDEQHVRYRRVGRRSEHP
jgi:UDPglucose 6-dehydrogenase